MKKITQQEKDICKVILYSDRIQSIVEDKDKMTNGDYQGCIEAVIMSAIQYGRSK